MAEDAFLTQLNSINDQLFNMRYGYLKANNLSWFTDQVLSDNTMPFIHIMQQSVQVDKDDNAQEALKNIVQKFNKLLTKLLKNQEHLILNINDFDIHISFAKRNQLLAIIHVLKRQIELPYLQQSQEYQEVIQLQQRVCQKNIKRKKIITQAIINPELFLQNDNYLAYFKYSINNKKKVDQAQQKLQNFIQSENDKIDNLQIQYSVFLEQNQFLLNLSTSIQKIIINNTGFQVQSVKE